MRRSILAIAVLLICCPWSAYSAADAQDAVTKAWRTRAALATKRLAGAGLDDCDRALETAFQNFKEDGGKNGRSFFLDVTVGKESMVASYHYDGAKLQTFSIGSFPSRWVLMQKVDSKTMSVFPLGTKCAFDLCSNDPMADGPCPPAP